MINRRFLILLLYIQPIAGIISVLEVIQCLATEASALLKAEPLDMKKLESIVRSGLEATHTIRSVTNFMLSTVNRCLDYTKVCAYQHTY